MTNSFLQTSCMLYGMELSIYLFVSTTGTVPCRTGTVWSSCFPLYSPVQCLECVKYPQKIFFECWINRQMRLFSEKLVASVNLSIPFRAFRPFVKLQIKLPWKYMRVTLSTQKYLSPVPFHFTNENNCENNKVGLFFLKVMLWFIFWNELIPFKQPSHKFIFHLFPTIMCINSYPNDLFISRLANYAENTMSL